MNERVAMEISARQAQIVELIRHGEFVTVDALARLLDVVPQTIRRDVNALCDLGLARRRHGGVERAVTSGNTAYAQRRLMNQEAKAQIAAAVAERIPDDSSISLGIGTTPAMVVDALSTHRHLTIYTNNLSAAITASANHEFDVHIAGGRIRNSDQDVAGAAAEHFFASYRTDFGIFGVGGIDPDGCLLDFSDEEVRIRESIRRNCRRSILVADLTKFSRPAHVRGGWLHEADIVICDHLPPPELVNSLREHARELIVCDKVPAL